MRTSGTKQGDSDRLLGLAGLALSDRIPAKARVLLQAEFGARLFSQAPTDPAWDRLLQESVQHPAIVATIEAYNAIETDKVLAAYFRHPGETSIEFQEAASFDQYGRLVVALAWDDFVPVFSDGRSEHFGRFIPWSVDEQQQPPTAVPTLGQPQGDRIGVYALSSTHYLILRGEINPQRIGELRQCPTLELLVVRARDLQIDVLLSRSGRPEVG